MKRPPGGAHGSGFPCAASVIHQGGIRHGNKGVGGLFRP